MGTLDGATENEFILVLVLESIYMMMDALVIVSLCMMFVKPFMRLIRLIGDDGSPTSGSTQIEMVVSTDLHRISVQKRKVSFTEMGNAKQLRLFHAATKITLLILVSLCSSFAYSLSWNLSLYFEHQIKALYLFTWTWGFDNAVNITCLFLSYAVSQNYYNNCCIGGIRLHSCFARCIQTIS